MRRRLIVGVMAGGLMAALLPGVASAVPVQCETGRQYAQDHIVLFAKAGDLGNPNAGAGHRPGTHQGFANVPAVCAHD